MIYLPFFHKRSPVDQEVKGKEECIKESKELLEKILKSSKPHQKRKYLDELLKNYPSSKCCVEGFKNLLESYFDKGDFSNFSVGIKDFLDRYRGRKDLKIEEMIVEYSNKILDINIYKKNVTLDLSYLCFLLRNEMLNFPTEDLKKSLERRIALIRLINLVKEKPSTVLDKSYAIYANNINLDENIADISLFVMNESLSNPLARYLLSEGLKSSSKMELFVFKAKLKTLVNNKDYNRILKILSAANLEEC